MIEKFTSSKSKSKSSSLSSFPNIAIAKKNPMVFNQHLFTFQNLSVVIS